MGGKGLFEIIQCITVHDVNSNKSSFPNVRALQYFAVICVIKSIIRIVGKKNVKTKSNNGSKTFIILLNELSC